MNYSYTYQQESFGTERHLLVYDDQKRIIGHQDPFPNGIPSTPLARKRRLSKVARDIASAWELAARAPAN